MTACRFSEQTTAETEAKKIIYEFVQKKLVKQKRAKVFEL